MLTPEPNFSSALPAQRLTTPLGWSDLVLGAEVLDELAAMRTWLRHSHTLPQDRGLAKVVKPGYRSLFFGPPGTGKTLVATLLGQDAGMDVYRIDLSRVISKYIGETEKNLDRVFDRAQNQNWLLYFDEADALLGQRSTVSSGHDRYANQELGYWLQRMEDFSGLAILASNLKANIDEAFARHFHSLVCFSLPDAEQRLRLWQGLLGHTGRLAADVDLQALAQAHELSGGAIANVVRAAAITALQGGRQQLQAGDLLAGVIHELRKEGRRSPGEA